MTESDCSIDSGKTPRLQPSLTKGIGCVVTLHDYARTGSCRRLLYDGNNQKCSYELHDDRRGAQPASTPLPPRTNAVYVAISGTPHLVFVWCTCDRWYVHMSSRHGCLRCGFGKYPKKKQITLTLLKNKS
ncbi:hypothetical protein ALC56_09656 [Trachymyrmex septentrionalis]|uniref:Uncharacterized protein n=1 Tax=Trachymyrmex septentrionalis TaxID=34720 RepID=A0A195F5J7_9HYME|nr:hypothetical protein ALC56_09656 [Trachymyrmex septentrionalis]